MTSPAFPLASNSTPDLTPRSNVSSTPPKGGRLWLAGLCTVVIVGALSSMGAFELAHNGQIYPGVRVAGIAVGGLTPTQARSRLLTLQDQLDRRTVTVQTALSPQSWTVTGKDIGVAHAAAQAVAAAYAVGRSGSWLTALNAQRRALLHGTSIPLPIYADPTKADHLIATIARQLDRMPVDAQVTLDQVSGQVLLKRAAATGLQVDQAPSASRLIAALLGSPRSSSRSITLVTHVRQPRVTATMAREFIERMNQWLATPLQIQAASTTRTLSGLALARLIDMPATGVDSFPPPIQVSSAAVQSLLDGIASQVDRAPVDAQVIAVNGLPRVIPATSGQRLLLDRAMQALIAALQAGPATRSARGPVVLTVQSLPPHVATAEAQQQAASIQAVLTEQQQFLVQAQAHRTSAAQTATQQLAATLNVRQSGANQQSSTITRQQQEALGQAALANRQKVLDTAATQQQLLRDSRAVQSRAITTLLRAPVTLVSGSISMTVAPSMMAALLQPQFVRQPSGVFAAAGVTLNIDRLKIALAPLAARINRPARNATFAVDGQKAWVVPDQHGRQLDFATLAQNLASLRPGQRELPVPITDVVPHVTTGALQALHITSAVGSSETYWYGSTYNRVINLMTAMRHLDGTLIAPNEVFSFNTAIGDISYATGYVEGIDIINNKDVPGIGGGVCQIAVTLFKGAIYSGLPIVERVPHANIVSYYQPVGMDATIYTDGGPDVKFKNNTGHWLMFKFEPDPATERMGVTFYGTPIGRNVAIAGPYYTYYKNGDVDAIFYRSVSDPGKAVVKDSFFSHYVPVGAAG